MAAMTKPFKITFIVLVIVFGSLFLWNVLKSYLIKRHIAANQPIMSVSTSKAVATRWQPHLDAVGTLMAINGVEVSSQEAGKIINITFESGQCVNKNDLLVQLDDRIEQAQLQNNLAALKLAEITYLRNKTLIQQGAISHQAFDEASAKYQQAQATVAQTQTTIDYKHITAPFSGKVGIYTVNLGQYVRPGDPLVELEQLDPLHINFYLPEQTLHQLKVGQPITLTTDATPNQKYTGQINAIDSSVDIQTHNINVQAIVSNSSQKLYPGLFARVQVMLAQQNVVTVPETAINYSLYGDTVYIITHPQKDKQGHISATIVLRTVTIGKSQQNKIIVTKGLKPGEEVVSSGQLKLSNGQKITINNSVQP